MNICICISGQIRNNLSNLEQLSRQIKKLEEKANITVIISTWEQSGKKTDGALRYLQMNRIFDNLTSRIIPINFYGINFWKNLPKTHNLVSSQVNPVNEKSISKLFKNSIIDIEKEILNLEFDFKTPDKNSIKMLYKIWRCNEIKRQIEQKEGKKFDFVLRMRPDVKFKIKDNFLDFEKETIYLPINPNTPEIYNDEVAYGDSQSIDIYSSLFKRTFCKDWKRIHHELFEHLNSHLTVKHCHSIDYYGLETNDEKIGIWDIMDDIDFIDIIKSLSHLSLEEQTSEIEKIANKKSLSKYSLTSLHQYLSFKFESVGNFNQALIFLLKGELSLIEMNNFKHDKEAFIINKLIYLSMKEELDDIEVYIEKNINSNIIKKNIDKIKGDTSLNNKLFTMMIHRHSKSLSPSYLSKISKKIVKNNKIADFYRDKALSLDLSDIETSLMLMEIAKYHRPDGPLINRKIKEYKKTINKG